MQCLSILECSETVVISFFAIGYSMLGKTILKTAPPSVQKFDLGDTGKAGCYHRCIRDDGRVSRQTEETRLSDRAAPKSSNRMGTENARVNQLYQQTTYVGNQSKNKIHRIG